MADATETTATPEVTAAPEQGAAPVEQEQKQPQQSQETPEEGKEEQPPEQGEKQQEGEENGEQKQPELTPEEKLQATFKEELAKVTERIKAELQAEKEAQKVEQPDFIPDLDLDQVNAYIDQTEKHIEELRLEGKSLEAIKLQRHLTALVDGVDANEQKKAAWEAKQAEQQQQTQQVAAINAEIAKASELVAKEYNIAPDLWKKAEDWFIGERKAKPLIDQQYRDLVYRQGPVAALLWAKEYVEKNMGAGAKADIAKKEEAKGKIPSVNPNSETIVAGKTVKNWDDLMKLPSKEINKFCKENNKEFQRLKNAHFK